MRAERVERVVPMGDSAPDQAAGAIALRAAAEPGERPIRGAPYRHTEAFDLYLHDLTQIVKDYPILEKEQEQELAKRIEAGWAAGILLELTGATDVNPNEAWQDLKSAYDTAQHTNKKRRSKPGSQKPEALPRDINIPAELGRWATLVATANDAKRQEQVSDSEPQEGLGQLTPEVLRQLVIDGETATDTFIKSNVRLVIGIARKYLWSGWKYGDLVQEGSLGMIHAAAKFDYAKGYKFSTYASIWINQAIRRALANKGRAIRLPVAHVEKIWALHNAKRELDRIGDPAPTDIARYAKTTPETMEELLAADEALTVYSLDALIAEDTSASFGDLIADADHADPADFVLWHMGREQVWNLLHALPSDEGAVIRRLYGFDGRPVYTPLQVAAGLGMSPDRVRRLEAQALRTLRIYAGYQGVTDDILERE